MPVIDRRLLAGSRVARRQLVLTVLFGLAAAALLLAQAGFLSDVLAEASAGLPARVWRGALLGLALVVTTRALVAGAAETTALRAAEEVRTGVRGRVVAAVLRQGPAGLGGRPSGELTALLTRGLDTLDVYVARFLPSTALAVIVPPVVLLRIAAADWVSALILLGTAPLVPVFMALVGRYTRARTARQWRLLAQLGGHFLDVVAGLPTLTVFGRADAQVEVIREVSERHRRTTLATLRIAFTSALVLELLATVGTALVAVAVGLRLLAGGLDYRTALLVLLLAPEVYLPLRALGGQFHASADGGAAADEAFARLDEAAATAAPASGRPLPAGLEPGAIEFDRVSLTYPGRPRAALEAVGFVVRPGSLVVLDGPVGSGKSSVLSLLMGFASATAGQVRVDGHPLDELDVEAWRRQVGWVSQTPYLFAGSLADNVRLGRPGADDGAVEKALDRAGCTGFVAALPDGPGTPIGERGLGLSAGQRQRLALARAFLRDAPLLLLDEPTAHLDPITAGGIRAAVDQLMADRTVLLVTHHRAWRSAADVVLTLRDGRLERAAEVVR